jgi:hypothetical protein
MYKISWLSLMVLTNWLLNLTNEVCSVYSRMCIQNIFQFNTIVCHIFFAPKCGHVLYIHELKGSHSHINVLVSTHWGTFSFAIHSQPIKKRIVHYCSLRLVSILRKQIIIFYFLFIGWFSSEWFSLKWELGDKFLCGYC